MRFGDSDSMSYRVQASCGYIYAVQYFMLRPETC